GNETDIPDEVSDVSVPIEVSDDASISSASLLTSSMIGIAAVTTAAATAFVAIA
ncbi:MAG: hypothetical protein ACI8RD_008442, partial [Bacillariaceae sp.]